MSRVPGYKTRTRADWWFMLVVASFGFVTTLWNLGAPRGEPIGALWLIVLFYGVNAVACACWTLTLLRLHRYPPVPRKKVIHE